MGRFGRLKTGIWLFAHETECMILEMPDQSIEDSISKPWKRIKEYIDQKKLNLKFMTATHVHADHFDTFPMFHSQFPQVPIIVNRHFFPNEKISFFISPEALENGTDLSPSIRKKGVPIYCFETKCFETNLQGEPLFLIHAPKHSWSDTMLIFRGCIISGDWWIGPGDPNANQIPIDVINESLDYLQAFCRPKKYHVHSLFSVHANEFRRGINFFELLEQTRP